MKNSVLLHLNSANVVNDVVELGRSEWFYHFISKMIDVPGKVIIRSIYMGLHTADKSLENCCQQQASQINSLNTIPCVPLHNE